MVVRVALKQSEHVERGGGGGGARVAEDWRAFDELKVGLVEACEREQVNECECECKCE